MVREKRRHPRVTYGEDVLLNKTIKAKGLSISEEGVYVHTGRYFHPQSLIELRLPVGKETFTLTAQVRHAQQGIGMGLRLMDLLPVQRLSLKEFVAGRISRTGPAMKNTVLIVDDNEMTRRIYKSKLVLDGFRVFEAADLLFALDLLRREPISLVVVNPYLAREDGFKLVAAIRNTPEYQALKVLVLTHRGTPDDMQKAGEAGADEFLLKMSTSPVKLSERVRAHLQS